MPLVDAVTMPSPSDASAAAKPRPPRPSSPGKATGAALTAPELRPIAVNDTAASRALRYSQPAAVAAVFAYAFPALVADPVAALGLLLPVTAAAQLAWAVVCLPPAGAAAARAKAARARPGEKKRARDAAAAGPNVAVVRTAGPAAPPRR